MRAALMLLHKITLKDLIENQIAHSEGFRELYHRSFPTHVNQIHLYWKNTNVILEHPPRIRLLETLLVLHS